MELLKKSRKTRRIKDKSKRKLKRKSRKKLRGGGGLSPRSLKRLNEHARYIQRRDDRHGRMTEDDFLKLARKIEEMDKRNAELDEASFKRRQLSKKRRESKAHEESLRKAISKIAVVIDKSVEEQNLKK